MRRVPLAEMLARSGAEVALWIAVVALGAGGAQRLLPATSTPVRLCAAFTIAAVVLAGVFWATLGLGVFKLGLVLPVLAAVAWWLGGSGRARRLLVDASAGIRATWRETDAMTRAAGFVVLTCAAIRTARGSVSPPLGWDSLTYHLVKAARWVRDGSFVPEVAPDAASYYEYFPPLGDIYLAWTMLAPSSAGSVALFGVVCWTALGLGVFAAARAVGSDRNRASMVGVVVVGMPSTLCYLESGYVDNLVAALFVIGVALQVASGVRKKESASPDTAIASAALGHAAFIFAAGIKLTLVPVAVLGAGFTWAAMRRAGSTSRARWALFLLVVVALAAVGHLRAWSDTGSPLYPFALSLGGREIFQGHAGLAALARGETIPWEIYSPARVVASILYEPQKGGGAFLNPGPAAVALPLIAGMGVPRMAGSGHRRALALLGLCVAVFAAGYMSNNMSLFRSTIKVTTAGRYFVSLFAALAIVASAAPRHRGANLLLAVTAVTGAWLARPQTLAPIESFPIALAVAGLVALAIIGWWSLTRGAAATFALGSVAALLIVARAEKRADLRAPIHDLLPTEGLFHMHPLNRGGARASTVWSAVDGEHGLTIAAAAGWDGLGHNWYRFPLFGARLQNDVIYVPIAPDNAIMSYAHPPTVMALAEKEFWVRGLVEREVDVFVLMAPRDTQEQAWIKNLPAIFPRTLEDENGLNAAYWVDLDAARRWLKLRQQARG
jgi:hypothetical protein